MRRTQTVAVVVLAAAGLAHPADAKPPGSRTLTSHYTGPALVTDGAGETSRAFGERCGNGCVEVRPHRGERTLRLHLADAAGAPVGWFFSRDRYGYAGCGDAVRSVDTRATYYVAPAVVPGCGTSPTTGTITVTVAP